MFQQTALPLDLLLPVLMAQQMSVRIWAEVSPDLHPVLKQRTPKGTHCQASVVVAHGQIVALTITDHQDTVLLAGQIAFDCVRQCDRMVWTLRSVDQFPEGYLPPELAQHVAGGEGGEEDAQSEPARCPHPSGKLEKRMWEVLSHKHRMTLLLADGQHSVAR